MLWTLIAFGISMFLLRKLAYPRIQAALEKRAHAVAASIDAAERTRQEADQILQEYRERLREAREQKERAIAARHAADRERDEAVARFEEKCRDMERFEESASAHYHATHKSEGGGARTYTRTVSSGTTLHHDGHGHSASGMFSSP